MEPQIVLTLAAQNEGMSSVDRLVNIHWLVRLVLSANVCGDLVEVGCNAGRTSVFLRLLLDECNTSSHRELHVYDSFQGMPKPSDHDAHLIEGDCLTDLDEFRNVFAMWNVQMPVVHPGWFRDTLPAELPKRVAFAYLDGDFYDSIQVSLTALWPRLTPGAIVLIDDYGDRRRNPLSWEGLPGVRKAVDEFLADRPEQLHMLVGTSDLSMAWFRKEQSE